MAVRYECRFPNGLKLWDQKSLTYSRDAQALVNVARGPGAKVHVNRVCGLDRVMVIRCTSLAAETRFVFLVADMWQFVRKLP